MKAIRAVIFDVGRVLVTLDPSREKFGAVMRAMGISPDRAFEQYWFTPAVRRHMTGEIDSTDFFQMARAHFGLPFDFDEFAAGWCDLFAPMPGMEKLFGKVAKKYGVGILSDTDPLHWARVRSLLPWLARVAKPTLSHEVGFLKPHPAMFAAAAANCGSEKSRCLFIDDIPANVDGARAVGMPSLLFANAAQLEHDLEKLGVL